jgi:hypothetical protein
MKTPIALILAASLAAGCATTGGGSMIRRSDDRADARFARYEPYLGEPVSGFTAWRYDSWEPISRTQLVLRTTMNNAYLLTVDGTCTDLPYAQTIGVTTTGNQVTKFDSVLVRNERCLIRQIRPIDVKQMRTDERAADA